MTWAMRRLARIGSGISAIAASGQRIALVDADGSCHLGAPPAQLRRIPDLRFADLAGLGYRGDVCSLVRTSGVRVDLSPTGVTVTAGGPKSVRGWALAEDAPVSARIVANSGGWARDDTIEVWDERSGTVLCRIAPPSVDCFQIDRVAVDARGGLVAWTGLAVVYDTDGDWCSGQRERVGVAEIPTGVILLDAEVGVTYRPSEHAALPVALADPGVIGGPFLLPAHIYAGRTPPSRDAGTVEVDAAEVGCELSSQPDRAVSLPGEQGFVLAVGTRVQRVDARGAVVAEVELPSPVTALAGTASGPLVGCADGTLWRLTGSPH